MFYFTVMVSSDISSLVNEIGKGKISESDIRGAFLRIEDQAKAQETELEKAKADLNYAEKRITELELKLHKQEQKRPADRLEELTERILEMFFDAEEDDGIVATGQLAAAFDTHKGIAQHHCDLLYEAGMINWAGIDSFYILPKGRAYVVKYLLNE